MAGPLPEQHAQILAQKLADGQLALFVGAGLSRQAVAKDGSGRKLPLWIDLAKQVAAACNEDLATYNGNVLDLFDAIVFGQSRFDLEEAVRQAIDDSGFGPSPAHDALARLPWAGIYTTNYDGLLGRVLNETPVAEDDHYDRLQRAEGQRPRLFHVHGTQEKPHTLTRDDYRLWPEKHPRAYRDLEAVVLNKTVLFVGYSLSDPHLADGLLPVVRKITAGREKRLYAWMWQVPPNQVQLLDRRDKIEAIRIDQDEDWVAAFQQLGDCLRAVTVRGAVPVAGPDPYAYDRQQYVAAMEARYGFANLQGLYVGGAGYARTDVSLEEVFVDPDLEVTPAGALAIEGSKPADGMSLRAAMHERRKDREDEQNRQRAHEQPAGREPAERVLAREPKLLIIGAPGQGKSTLLRQALLQAAGRWRERPDEEPFPVLVKLSDWEAEEGPCEGRLAEYVASRLPKMGEIGSQAVAVWLKSPVLWLLDGIDEIRDPGERVRLTQEVQAGSALRPNDRWVIATRPAGEPRGGLGTGWTRAVLPNLSDQQIEQVLVRWDAVLKKKEGLELDARQVAADLKRDPGLRQVRGNALLLTLFFKTRKRLPHDRWEFYAAADASLCDTWVAHRIREAQRYLPGDYLPELLDRLALEAMIEGGVLFDCATLKDAAKSALAVRGYTGGEQDREAERFVAAAEDLIGVLVAQAPNRFGFLHLTFQEFYAARAVARKGEDERTRLIARFWDHPDWREVWPLYALAVQSEPAKYEQLFATILDNGYDLDDRLFRPRFACLRLAGVGTGPLPMAMASVTGWALDELQGRDWQFFRVLEILGTWERRLTDDLGAAVLARLVDKRESVRRAAVQALAGAVGDAEVRVAVLARLADDDRDVRREAALALAAAAGEAEVRVAVLARLADDDRDVRREAALALAAAAGETEVRAALLARLADNNWDVRQAAAQALAAAVAEAEVRTALLARIADDDWSVRAAAAQALAAAVAAAEVRTALLARLADADGFVRSTAAGALAAAVGEAEVRAALLARLGDDEGLVRRAAAGALAAAVGEAEVRAALLARLGDDEGIVRRAAAGALAAAVGEAEVRAALLARLADADWHVREVAAVAIGAHFCKKPKVEPVIEVELRSAIISALTGNDIHFRMFMTKVLTWFDYGGNDVDIATALLAQLDEAYIMKEDVLRSMAVVANNPQVRAAIMGFLDHKSHQLRYAATYSLATTATEPKVCAALITQLMDLHWDVRRAAARALAPVVCKPDVRSALLARLFDDDHIVRRLAVEAITRTAGETEIRRMVLARLADDDKDVRQAAVGALAAWIVAEKFGLPVADVVPIYP